MKVELKPNNEPVEEGQYLVKMEPEMEGIHLVTVYRGLERHAFPPSSHSGDLFFDWPIPGGTGHFRVDAADLWSDRLKIEEVDR